MHRAILGVVVVLAFAASVSAQTEVVLPDCRVVGLPKPYADGDFRLTVRCEKNGSQKPVIGDKAQIIRPILPPPPPPPPPTGDPIWGVSAPDILGDFTAAEHDAYSLSGGDGYRYRTWHPQCVSGRCFAHEHGDNPAIMQHAEIASTPVLFGYIGRRHPMADEPYGHQEPHEGFKVFISNVGDVNDEGRVSRAYSRSIFHMGTGGPRRFTTQHHSADIRVIHPEFGLKAFTRLMMDTGGTGIVCDPRSPAPTKDVIALDFVQRCGGAKLGSGYEIWSTEQDVRNAAGEIVYRAFATPAVFDPVTAFNPADPNEVVYIGGVTDPRVQAIRAFNDDWTGSRGCERESYAQPGYFYNGGGPTVYYTDAMGRPLPSSDPLVLRQEISASDSIGAPTTSDGLGAFKMRVSYCDGTQHSGGSISPRPGIAGTLNQAKMGLKN